MGQAKYKNRHDFHTAVATLLGMAFCMHFLIFYSPHKSVAYPYVNNTFKNTIKTSLTYLLLRKLLFWKPENSIILEKIYKKGESNDW